MIAYTPEPNYGWPNGQTTGERVCVDCGQVMGLTTIHLGVVGPLHPECAQKRKGTAT